MDSYEHNSSMEFNLRPMEPGDGPGLDALLLARAGTKAMSITTHHRYDVAAALAAQHPGLFGVVATAPDVDGIVGMATAYLDDVQVEGELLPCAHLENLKVRHDLRQHGLGQQLAEWRIAEARRRIDGPLVVVAGIQATNASSRAAAQKWASQTLGPLPVLIASSRQRRPSLADLTVRPIEDGDVEAVVEASNAFYAGTNLYPRLTPDRLRGLLAPMDPGGSVRQYRVAATPGGALVAGALVMRRYELMTDHVERIPRALAVLNRVVRLVPADGVLRSVEASLPWFAPGQLQAGRRLWAWLLHEWHDHASNVLAVVDPRSDAAAMCRAGRSIAPKLRMTVAVDSPVPLSVSRPIAFWH